MTEEELNKLSEQISTCLKNTDDNSAFELMNKIPLGAHYAYGLKLGLGLKAVADANLEIRKNQLYGLIGPNGAGKTTAFNIITGVYKPTTGKYYLCGEDVTGLSQQEICKKGIARTFQNIRLYNNMSVIQNVMVGMANNPMYHCNLAQTLFRTPRFFKTERAMRQAGKELLQVFGLYELRNEQASNLPYGKQRKLEIARALATNPKLLLLDEPAAGMNEEEICYLHTGTGRQNLFRSSDGSK